MLGVIILCIIILAFISSISPVNINLKFMKEDEKNEVIIKVRMLYGLIRFKKEISEFNLTAKKKEEDGDVDEELELEIKSDSWSKKEDYTDFIDVRRNIEKIINMVKKYKNVIHYILDRINLHTFFWKTEVGFDDAALTGLAIGIINIFKSNIFVMFNNISIRPRNIHLKVLPNFNNRTLKTNIHSIFKVKLGYIIIAGLKYLFTRKRYT
ncbi:DUF2953 domain-containing protein [Wukongibacter sp. M2B1]|uniref:DUF2953 domain-containing protein n=1 Tax=Wukongibacter sp. M2B1 TaxID=3088895 RepID=UPI003D79B471